MKKILPIVVGILLVIVLIFIAFMFLNSVSRTGPVPSYIQYAIFSPNVSYNYTIWAYDLERQEVVGATPNNTVENLLENNQLVELFPAYRTGTSIILSTASPLPDISDSIDHFALAESQIVKGIKEIFFCGARLGEKKTIRDFPQKAYGDIPVAEIKNANCIERFIPVINDSYCCISLESPSIQ